MAPRYNIGQRVIITPISEQPVSSRDSALERYAGQTGKVTDYYWITKERGEVFYIYTVLTETDNKKIVLHEDELKLSTV
ncbi:MAG: hypothetical protein HY663_06480 [Chloroflexi bacterium]|nr:hypothetical protein [Chloroflexota bacterium]